MKKTKVPNNIEMLLLYNKVVSWAFDFDEDIFMSSKFRQWLFKRAIGKVASRRYEQTQDVLDEIAFGKRR